MKIKPFALGVVLSCICCVGRAEASPDRSAPAQPAPVQPAPVEMKVTRDNFVSLSWSVRSRADESRTFDYGFDKDSISLFPVQIGGGYGGFGGNAVGTPSIHPPDVRPLSTHQFEALLQELQLADVPALARQNSSVLKPQEFLTLVLSDENNADQTFALAFGEEKKPATYRKLSDCLTALVRSKGLATTELETPATS